MISIITVLAVVAVLILAIIIKGLKIVQQSTVMIVERLGKYHKTMKTGVNIIIPFLDKIRLFTRRISQTDSKGHSNVRIERSNFIDLRETVYDFPKQMVITKDNVSIEINAILYYQITDPFKATYEIEDLSLAIEKLTQTTLRNVIGELELDQTLTSRDTINGKLRDILDDATDKWGVKVNRVELQDIMPSREIREAMEKQMRAERERRETILLAEGAKKAKVLEAEGERDKLIAEAEGAKQSQILRATGEAEARMAIANAEAQAIAAVADALKGSDMSAAQYQVALKYIGALESIAAQNGEKVVFMPFESSALMGSVSSLKELWDKK